MIMIEGLVDPRDRRRAKAAIARRDGAFFRRKKVLLNEREKLDNQFCYAAEEGNLQKVKNLLEKGADVNAEDSEGVTVLMNAVFGRQIEIIEFLIERGADIHAKSSKGECTTLMCASYEGYKEIVELLIENGADVDAKEGYGRTALMWAEESGHTEIVEILRKAGAAE